MGIAFPPDLKAEFEEVECCMDVEPMAGEAFGGGSRPDDAGEGTSMCGARGC